MSAYYNEHDAYAAEWLRNLIAAGHIAPGDVDERSIEDVEPDDLRPYTQCHFFAGIGIWSHALRRAGWPDDRAIWTGSCPCQPFSAAGKAVGFADERHLWPAWAHLIGECRPPIVVGEQVASKDGLGWLDLVSADLEGAGYAFGASDLCAAGFGGAHIRQRLYFVGGADAAYGDGRGGKYRTETGVGADEERRRGFASGGDIEWLDHASSARHEQEGRGQPEQPQGRECLPSLGCGSGGLGNPQRPGLPQQRCEPGIPCVASSPCEGQGVGRADAPIGGLADGETSRRGKERTNASGLAIGDSEKGRPARLGDGGGDSRPHAPMLGRNAADWLYCRDGKWRPVEPGSFPLVNAAPARVGRLRAYGNGLDAETATQFVEAVMEARLFL